MNAPAQKYPKLATTVAAINSIYGVQPQVFTVGSCTNAKGENLGSLAILGYAKLHNLRQDQVLLMFGEAYREVMNDPNPESTSHGNIRAFLKCGLDGVSFEGGGISLHPELKLIDDAWEKRAEFSATNAPKALRDAVQSVLTKLDDGIYRSAMKLGDHWRTNQEVKKAVLLSFKLSDNEIMGSGNEPVYFDKVPLKFQGWDAGRFQQAGFRVVPGAVVRQGSFVGKNVIVMPSFVNIGAYVDEGTMVDAWATVGSCAQIGKNVHLSGGVGIGGVLEPLQANPTIIEDNCFIGARSEVVEGVVVGEGSVLSMGCYVSQSTKILNRVTGETMYGEIPPYSVVVPGTLPGTGAAGHALNCVVIVKTVDAQTRAKTAINELLRDQKE